MPLVKCLNCDNQLEFDDEVEVGDVAECDSCDSEFEVIGLDPIELDDLEDEEEEEEDSIVDDDFEEYDEDDEEDEGGILV